MAEAADLLRIEDLAAFALGKFHELDGGGSKFLLLWRDCCLCAWWVSSGQQRRQQNPASVA